MLQHRRNRSELSFGTSAGQAQLDLGKRCAMDLRHFCASSLIDQGVTVKGVQPVLGHWSATETLEVYAHLWPADHDRLREAMTAALERGRVTGEARAASGSRELARDRPASGIDKSR